MNLEDVKSLVGVAKLLRPAQDLSNLEAVALAWHIVLDDVDPQDGMVAFAATAKEDKWIDPTAIRNRALGVRRLRLTQTEVPAPVNPDDVEGYKAQLRAMFADVAAGREIQAPASSGVARDRKAELEARITETLAGGSSFQSIRALEPPVARPMSRSELVEMRAKATGKDEEFVRQQLLSQAEMCDHCLAAVGEGCLSGDGLPLTSAPAHPSRLRKVGVLPPHRSVGAEEFGALLVAQGLLDPTEVERLRAKRT